MNKLVVFGSRNIIPSFGLLDALSYAHNCNFGRIVSGGARGVDNQARKWAENKDYPFIEFPADWDQFGLKAGYMRNKEMAEYATHGICVWDGKSPGTKNMIDLMVGEGKPLVVYIEGR